MSSGDPLEDFPLNQAINNEILMQREVHFGGQFKVMLDYYRKGGKGVQPEFELEAIQNLATLELRSGKNLAPILLSGPEAEKIARAKEAYQRLKLLYEKENEKTHYPRLIADLILSEDENPEREIAAIVKEGTAIVPALLELLKAEDFFDPLFPGYGLAPQLAAKCLGRIGDRRAIIALFEALSGEDFFSEDEILAALHSCGEAAKTFLLRVVSGKPINEDNEKAAMALIRFKDDQEVANLSLDLLEKTEIRKDLLLATYLILICEGLQNKDLQERFLRLAEDPTTPSELLTDIQTVGKLWQS